MQTTLAYAPTPEELAEAYFFDTPVLFQPSRAPDPDDEEAEQGEP
ncbi:MAG TPA: hypothetical protein PLH11_09125 [Gemmobacter sp.]|nr:hypothetical protein [Gemmobacter sp.]